MGKVGTSASDMLFVQSMGKISTSKVDVFFTADRHMPIWITLTANGGTNVNAIADVRLNSETVSKQVSPAKEGLFSSCSVFVALMLKPGDVVQLHINKESLVGGTWYTLSTEKVEFK